MENIKDEFRKEFCECCGSQRCSGQDDELEYCERFKNIMDNSGMPLDDDDKLATEATIMGKKILPPDGYLVGKITQTDNGMLVEYVEKKSKYPKTYKECCERVNACPTVGISYDSDEDMLYNDEVDLTLLTLRKLLICRNAYWKIAGEEMGLGKPWKPDWLSGRKEEKYCIATQNNEIWHNFSEYGGNEILAFPTIEMRDVFYENFKELIESCKELL